ncbi:hypothetical protein F5Y16DRAFT_389611 [Xylariaceae sp. FL0255]|nr:hypothetical protein F5Y16DRAFT_389611 [Xylariaceae sp. FL0255]
MRSDLENQATTEPASVFEEDSGGYAELGDFMGRQPQLAIFRRFGSLSNQTLLYLQAEITDLEHHLKYIQKRDNQSKDKVQRQYARSWYGLSDSASLPEPSHQREQYDLIMKIRKLTVEYHTALYFHKETLALRSPHCKLLKDLREWMSPSRGNISILSWDCRTWETCDETDLVTFENSEMDGFTSFVTHTVVDVYHNLIGRHIHKARDKSILPLNYADHHHTVTYSHRPIAQLTQTFTVFVTCTLPIVAIVVLDYVHGTNTRLAIIAALTGLFSISMNLLTTASLSDIFGNTSTFVAVLVFFLGSTNNAE